MVKNKAIYGPIARTRLDLMGIRFVDAVIEDGAHGDVVTETNNVPDVSAFEAKIAEHEATIASLTDANADLTNQLSAAKAANYDLVMSMPKDDTPADGVDVDVNNVVPEVDFDDLFVSKD